MFPMHQFRSRVFALATMFAFTLLAPVAVSAQEEEVVVLAPVAAPAVGSTSGEDVRAIRSIAAERALQRGDIGSLQEEHLYAIVAAAPSWDATSGYGAVEASRATIGHPAAGTLQVPADVRWAPVRAVAPVSPVEARRVVAAQQALRSPDLGSLQEDALLAVVSAGQSWDQTSGYGSVEASRATIGHPATSTTSEAALLAEFRAVELALSRYLGTDQQFPSCAVES